MRLVPSRQATYVLASVALIAAATPLLVDSSNSGAGELELVEPANAAMRAKPNVPSTRRKANAKTAGELTPAAAQLLTALAHRTADPSNAGALFAPNSWYVAPPPPAAAPPPRPAAPTAPPMPYTFLGSYAEVGRDTVYFLRRDNRVYDVKPGDTLDDTYTIDAVENDALVLTYKPLNTRQSLALGSGS
jgi:hypothetical protein